MKASIKVSIKALSIFAATLATTLMTAKAQAIVPQPGAFIPSRCGSPEAETFHFDVSVTQVCIGRISGEQDALNGAAVSFTLSDHSNTVFKIISTASELVAYMDGTIKTTYFLQNAQGEKASMKVTQSSDGEIIRAVGRVGTAAFFVDSFENVFVIQ